MSDIKLTKTDKLYLQSLANLHKKGVRLREKDGQPVYTKKDGSLRQKLFGGAGLSGLRALSHTIHGDIGKAKKELRTEATTKISALLARVSKKHQLRTNEVAALLQPITQATQEERQKKLAEPKNKDLSDVEKDELGSLRATSDFFEIVDLIHGEKQVDYNGQSTRVSGPVLKQLLDCFLEQALSKGFWGARLVGSISPVLACGLALTIVNRIREKNRIDKSDIALLDLALTPPYEREDGDGGSFGDKSNVTISVGTLLKPGVLSTESLQVIATALYKNFVAENCPEELNCACQETKDLRKNFEGFAPQDSLEKISAVWEASVKLLDVKRGMIVDAFRAASGI